MSMTQYQNKLKKWITKLPQGLVVAMEKGGEVVRTEAVLKHLSGPKMQRNVGHPTRATLQPHTGDLRSSINVKTRRLPQAVRATIGSSLKYARIQEKGGNFSGRRGRMPKRPYLKPSVLAKREEIKRVVLKTVMQEYQKTHG